MSKYQVYIAPAYNFIRDDDGSIYSVIIVDRRLVGTSLAIKE
jgi:hypothetical protein